MDIFFSYFLTLRHKEGKLSFVYVKFVEKSRRCSRCIVYFLFNFVSAYSHVNI